MADSARGILVLDATLLNHSARADNIDLLGAYLQKYECLTTDVVIDELRAGYSQYPERRAVDAEWIASDPLDTIQGITSYAGWLRRVGGGPRHRGEARVFACAEIRSGLAITDDR